MSSSRVKFLFIFITVLSSSILKAEELWPGTFFWQKPEMRRKMKEDRAVVVSVQHREKQWTMRGAGWVKASCPYVRERAQQYSLLEKIPQFFTKVEWKKELSQLRLTTKILGTEQLSVFKIWLSEKKDEQSGEKNANLLFLHFEVVEGFYSGAKGLLIFKNASQQSGKMRQDLCEVALNSVYVGKLAAFSSDVFAIPSIALEGILQIVAKSLRSGVEHDWVK